MPKFIVLQRDFEVIDPKQQFKLHTIEGDNRDDAWEKSDEKFASNCTQEWLMTYEEFKKNSVDEIEKGFMRQSDYTKKTQALSKEKKEYSEDDTKAMDLLKEA